MIIHTQIFVYICTYINTYTPFSDRSGKTEVHLRPWLISNVHPDPGRCPSPPHPPHPPRSPRAPPACSLALSAPPPTLRAQGSGPSSGLTLCLGPSFLPRLPCRVPDSLSTPRAASAPPSPQPSCSSPGTPREQAGPSEPVSLASSPSSHALATPGFFQLPKHPLASQWPLCPGRPSPAGRDPTGWLLPLRDPAQGLVSWKLPGPPQAEEVHPSWVRPHPVQKATEAPQHPARCMHSLRLCVVND